MIIIIVGSGGTGSTGSGTLCKNGSSKLQQSIVTKDICLGSFSPLWQQKCSTSWKRWLLFPSQKPHQIEGQHSLDPKSLGQTFPTWRGWPWWSCFYSAAGVGLACFSFTCTPRRISMEPKNYSNWKGKSSSKPPFWGFMLICHGVCCGPHPEAAFWLFEP